MVQLLRASVAVIALALSSLAHAAGESPEWVARSNANATPLLELIAAYRPETAASLGIDGRDADIIDLKPRFDERLERVRLENEDCARVAHLADGSVVVVVADGMGGHQAGEVASHVAAISRAKNLRSRPTDSSRSSSSTSAPASGALASLRSLSAGTNSALRIMRVFPTSARRARRSRRRAT
jgi:hypothetical protein